MRNIKLVIEYDGTHFSGWQIQLKRRTVQEVLEKALKQILQEKIRVIGSGRTDSGVHALGQVANFHTASKMPVAGIQRALNAILPDDIVIHKAEEASPGFHSRFKAKSKIYRYVILNRPHRSTRDNRFAYFYPWKLDVGLMRREAGYLLGKKDFKSFQAADKKHRASRRHLKNISIRRQGDFIYIDIESGGFLYKMCRNIVGTLIEIGRGKLEKGSIKDILKRKNRKIAGPTALAQGLTLLEVKY
jgi:tRNA pseudouridine38-40 synthase